MKKFCSLLLLLFLFDARASVPSESLGQRIASLRKQLFKLEGGLGIHHKNYLKNSEKRQEMGQRISSVKAKLSENEREIALHTQEKRKILKQILVDRLDTHESSESLMGQRVLRGIIEKKLEELAESKKANDLLNVEITKLEMAYKEYTATDDQLNQLILELETQKKNAATQYLSYMERKQVIEKTPPQQIARALHGEDVTPFKVLVPVKDYLNYTFEQKGVTFNINKSTTISAPEKGKVVYIGALGGFGNVIMLDHGQEIRSVVLGKFSPTVQKDTLVAKGDLVGKADARANQNEKIYFEIRKKNQAQKTIHWLKDISKS